jgi:uncharacterized membrane protein
MDMIDGDTNEPLKRRIERHSFDRLIMLSDGVFAISITLAALEIRPPDRWHDLPGLIAQLRFPVLAYLISFAVVASYWASQRELLSRLVRVDGPLMVLTLAQLLFVALIPAATQLISRNGQDTSAVTVYGGVLAACGYLAAATWAYGLFRPGLAHPETSTPYRWIRVATALIVPAFFTWIAITGESLSAAPIVMLAALLLMRRLILPRFGERRRTSAGEATTSSRL